jgi:CubicO group peptidase (beta-lactamase class C family)
MKAYKIALVFLLIIINASIAAAAGHYPGAEWQRVPIGETDFSPEKFELVKQYAGAMDSLAGMVVYDGRILHEWGDTAQKGKIHSVRKSMLSALYGIYAAEGMIPLAASMDELGIDDTPPSLSEVERRAKVLDLLKARSGVYHVAAYETDSMRKNRPPRGSRAPDTFWYYNNWDFNVLGTIFEKQTKTQIGKAFYDRVASPIGMQDFKVTDVSYIYGEASIFPAYPFVMTARDMARFGLLYMHDGKWHGKQVVPREWVAESTQVYSDAGPGVGYGYMWWVAKGWLYGTKMPVKAYRADGHGGQLIVVIPEYKLVVVHLSNYDSSKIDSHKQFAQLMRYILAARVGGQ